MVYCAPPPQPCTTLAAASTGIEGAKPAIRVPSAKIPIISAKGRAGPCRSAACPAVGVAAMLASA